MTISPPPDDEDDAVEKVGACRCQVHGTSCPHSLVGGRDGFCSVCYDCDCACLCACACDCTPSEASDGPSTATTVEGVKTTHSASHGGRAAAASVLQRRVRQRAAEAALGPPLTFGQAVDRHAGPLPPPPPPVGPRPDTCPNAPASLLAPTGRAAGPAEWVCDWEAVKQATRLQL